jgi:hypothetical protein
MTGKNIGIKAATCSAAKNVAFQAVIGAERPYYWSWYRIVFEEPETPVGEPVKPPPN